MGRQIKKAAEVKVKMHKKHGPKRKHPVGYSSTLEMQLAYCGVLKKKYSQEAHQQSEFDKMKNKSKSKEINS